MLAFNLTREGVKIKYDGSVCESGKRQIIYFKDCEIECIVHCLTRLT